MGQKLLIYIYKYDIFSYSDIFISGKTTTDRKVRLNQMDLNGANEGQSQSQYKSDPLPK